MSVKHTFAPTDTHSPEQCRGTTRRGFLTQLSSAVLVSAYGLPPVELSAGDPNRNSSTRVSKNLIYVVDDQADLNGLYRIVFEETGYEVKTFTNRVEALTSLLVANPQPALLITDYDGYPISAEELMHYCLDSQPNLKVLMVSGYAESCLSLCSVKPDRFLEKPFAIESLVEGVKSLIGRSRGPSFCD